MLADLGFGAYRFSLEWSRIEPEEGEWSTNALDHYRRMIAACRDNDLVPVVTFHHFTTPRWAAADGGWDNPAIVDRFGRYCERAAAHLGGEIGMGCTINEPNVVSLIGYRLSAFPPGINDRAAYDRVNENLKAAHRVGYDAIKSGPGDFPLGSCVAMGDWWSPEGSETMLADFRHMHEGQHLEAARGDDFVGVQAYSRTRLTEHGKPLGAEEGVETLDMGYEYWPQSLEVAIRYAAEVTGNPIYVTENGIGTTDDEQRIRYVGEALDGVDRCLDDGHRRARLLLLVAAGQLRVGIRLPAPVRAGGRRPRDPGPHDQAQRHLARRRRPGQPARLTLELAPVRSEDSLILR